MLTPPNRQRKILLSATIGALLLIIGGVGYALLSSGSDPSPAASPAVATPIGPGDNPQPSKQDPAPAPEPVGVGTETAAALDESTEPSREPAPEGLTSTKEKERRTKVSARKNRPPRRSQLAKTDTGAADAPTAPAKKATVAPKGDAKAQVGAKVQSDKTLAPQTPGSNGTLAPQTPGSNGTLARKKAAPQTPGSNGTLAPNKATQTIDKEQAKAAEPKRSAPPLLVAPTPESKAAAAKREPQKRPAKAAKKAPKLEVPVGF